MIIFFGPAGAGKSIQGQMLAARHGWRWLSAGQMLRDTRDEEIHKVLATGELVDNSVTYRLVTDAVNSARDVRRVVLDGFPRELEQTEWLLDSSNKLSRHVQLVVVIDVPVEEIMRRLAIRGRFEDKPDIIRRRLEIYESEVTPVLDLFRQRGVKVVEIDGVGTVGEVHDRIQVELEKCRLS